MKISYRTHPMLRVLNQKEFRYMVTMTNGLDDSDFHKDAWDIFNREREYFKSRIIHIKETFIDAVFKSIEKLNKDELRDELGEIYGTIFFRNATICYHFNRTSSEKTIFMFNAYEDNDGSFIKDTLDFVIDTKTSFVYLNIMYREDNNGEYKDSKKALYEDHKELVLFTGFVEYIHLFLKYAPIETKLVGANKRVKDFNTKYVNDTDLDVTILDSTWFTTLVKSEGFKVRGHFRLQPYGAGMKEKRLIWIKDFDKHGYTRIAKKPNEDTIDSI